MVMCRFGRWLTAGPQKLGEVVHRQDVVLETGLAFIDNPRDPRDMNSFIYCYLVHVRI